MAKIAACGRRIETRKIGFKARDGRVTRGGARPEKPQENVWDAVLAMPGNDPGWSVYTMSLLDGYHSVTLTLDASDPAQSHIYWSD